MKSTVFSLGALGLALAMPGHAAAERGDIQVKLLGTLVAPDGKVTRVERDAIGLPAGTQARGNDNVVPTLAVEYFVTDALSVETIAGVTRHDVDGRGALAGAELVADVHIVPATLTVKYHPAPNAAIRPYVGAGPSYFIFIDERPGAAAAALGATRQKVGDKLGVALQAGVDIPVNRKGLSVAIDAKRYLLRPTAHWYAGGTEVLRTRHRLDPWVLSAGVGLRF